MTTLYGLAVAALVMGSLAKASALLFHHDHAHGHCGWSGCQETT